MSTYDLLEKAINANLIPFLEGSPGTGKSATVRMFAEDYNLKLIDVRISTLDPTDLTGIPFKTTTAMTNGTTVDRVQHAPSTLFPIAGQELPIRYNADGSYTMVEKLDDNDQVVLDAKGNPVMVPETHDGWVVFFDELTSANNSLQGAVFRILLEREVAEYKLHPNVIMIAAGNKETDKGVVFPMATPLRNRLCVIEVESDYKEWIKWATANGISEKIISYIQWRPENLMNFDPSVKQINYPTQRTWEFASRLIKAEEDAGIPISGNTALFRLLKGVLGNIVIEFQGFLELFHTFPNIKNIIKDPAKADLPKEAGHQYALAGVLSMEMATNADPKEISAIFDYLGRMEPEIQVVANMDALRRNRKLVANADFDKWMDKNQDMVAADI